MEPWQWWFVLGVSGMCGVIVYMLAKAAFEYVANRFFDRD